MLSRRDLVGKLASGAAAVCAVGVARAGFASVGRTARTSGLPEGEPALPAPAPAEGIYSGPKIVDAEAPATLSAPQPWSLLHPLALGSVVAREWRVAGLTGVVDGSSVLTLENPRGRSYRVHLCRNDGQPRGLVYTKQFDLLVMNGGQGDLPTEESFAQAVAEVAHAIAANENQHQHAQTVAALMPHADRIARFADAAALR